MIIGITGGIGSGKSTAMTLLTENHIPCVDADDLLLHTLYQPGHSVHTRITNWAGEQVHTPSGAIDWNKLRDLGTPPWLNKVIVDGLWEQVKAQEALHGTIVFCSARLIEENFPVDHLIVIDVPEDLQSQRALERGMDPSILSKIIANQLPRTERLQRAHTIIDNSKDMAWLQTQLHTLPWFSPNPDEPNLPNL